MALFYPSFSHEITGITENSPELSGRGENENRGFTFLEANIFYGGVGNGMVNPTADSFFGDLSGSKLLSHTVPIRTPVEVFEWEK